MAVDLVLFKGWIAHFAMRFCSCVIVDFAQGFTQKKFHHIRKHDDFVFPEILYFHEVCPNENQMSDRSV